jgi:hypothetical protein
VFGISRVEGISRGRQSSPVQRITTINGCEIDRSFSETNSGIRPTPRRHIRGRSLDKRGDSFVGAADRLCQVKCLFLRLHNDRRKSLVHQPALLHRRQLVEDGGIERMLEPKQLAYTFEDADTHGVLDSVSAYLNRLENRTNRGAPQRSTRERDISPSRRKELEPGGDDIAKTPRQHETLARLKFFA